MKHLDPKNKKKKEKESKKDKDEKEPKKLKLTKGSQSGTDPRWPWKAGKVVDAEDPQPDVRKKDHTCTHSDFVPGNW